MKNYAFCSLHKVLLLMIIINVLNWYPRYLCKFDIIYLKLNKLLILFILLVFLNIMTSNLKDWRDITRWAFWASMHQNGTSGKRVLVGYRDYGTYHIVISVSDPDPELYWIWIQAVDESGSDSRPGFFMTWKKIFDQNCHLCLLKSLQWTFRLQEKPPTQKRTTYSISTWNKKKKSFFGGQFLASLNLLSRIRNIERKIFSF